MVARQTRSNYAFSFWCKSLMAPQIYWNGATPKTATRLRRQYLGAVKMIKNGFLFDASVILSSRTRKAWMMHMSHDDVCFPCCSFQEVNCPEECKSVENQMIRLGNAWTGLAVFHRQNHFLVRSSFKWFPAAITKSAWIWRRIWCTMTPWFAIITYDLCLMSYITSVNFIKKPPKLHSRSRPPLGWLVQAQPVGYGPAKHDRCQRCVWENHRIGLCQQGVVVRVFLILVPCIDPLTLKNG